MKAYQRSNFGTMGREAKQRLSNDNDIKILIVGKNSMTGIGKTTLAIQLCRYIDENWTAEKKSYIDVREYLTEYLDKDGGSALMLDEIEHGADSRRSTSKENVDLSQGWAKLRARNIATVATLPSISMLDKRMIELADYWVLVKKRGLAQPFRIKVNDFQPHRLPQRKPLPGDEHIKFVDLPDDDPDKEYLDRIKDEIVRSEGPKTIYKTEHEEKLESAKKEVRKETRDRLLEGVYRHTSAKQTEMAEAFPLNRETISRKVADIDPEVEKDRAMTIRNQAIKSLDKHTELTRGEIGQLEWVDLSAQSVGRIINS